MPLYDLKKDNQCTIKNLPDVKLLHSIGMRPGISVSVVSKQPLGGPIVVQVGARCIALGKDLAKQIEISNVRHETAFDVNKATVNEVC